MISPLLTWRTRYTDAFDCLNMWLWADERPGTARYPVERWSKERDAVIRRRDYLSHLLGLDVEVEYERPDDSHMRMEREAFE